MTIINFKDAEVSASDPSNRELLGKVTHQTIQMAMYVDALEATWMCNRTLRDRGYPLGHFSFPTNRKGFRLQVGQPFLLSYSLYNIENMICRVIGITEESVESEKIIVNAIEDIYGLGRTNDMDTVSIVIMPDINPDISSQQETIRNEDIDPLEHVKITEAPYHLSGDEGWIMTLAAKKNPLDIGYSVYNYYVGGPSAAALIFNASSFSIYGELVTEYSENTFTIDREVGFQIDFDALTSEINSIENISFEQLIEGYNLALLGEEIIGVQTMTNVSGNRYAFTGIYRGRFDTEKMTHPASEPFYFIGRSKFGINKLSIGLYSIPRYYKLVPYNTRSSGDFSEASSILYNHSLRGKKPYKPTSLKANNKAYNAEYSDDIVLTWNSRVRGVGTGAFPVNISDEDQSYEGTFTIYVKVGGITVRTVENIAALTWTYTEAMNLSDNGDLPTKVYFYIYNILNLLGTHYKIASPVNSILVRNRDGVDHGSPTTSSSTSSSSTTTSSTISSTSTSSSTTQTSTTVSSTTSSTQSTSSSSSSTTTTTA